MSKYIDADALDRDGWTASRTYSEDNHTMTYEVKKLTDFPTADVRENVKGEWRFSSDHAEGICTRCQYKIYGRPYNNTYLIVPYNFCPNCGAEMEGEEE